ncbi:lectin like domain-containing protein [Inediibacterium massiliense]|uniref:lectin like domain-containing protein n=1 Tax=Inediibacterium massiliense TaxID=1658111 RepID=UPI0006B4E06F|nr:lectin like domain-containing protein [Inediibacterium massiliense]
MIRKNRKILIVIACSCIFTLTAQLGISYGDTALPKKYDLREENRVTAVRDQGKVNGCWAFAALSSLESNMKDKNIDIDFSENHMMTHHGFDLKPTDGGNIYMAVAYLASFKGPVLEEKDPYLGTPIKREIYGEDAQIKDVIFIPKRKDFKDNEKIKKAIHTYGAVYTNIKWDDDYYNKEKKAYGSTSKLKGYDHTVTIIGWDDDYPKENFKSNEIYGDGAFLCKNSWGTSFGDEGYFYISYYDFNIGDTENAVFVGREKQYDNIYQYDPLGQTTEYGFGMDTAWFSNIFEAKASNEKLSGVSFYTRGEESEYEIWICRNFEDIHSFSTKEKIKSGKIDSMGYHTISIDSIELSKNEKFAVIVKLITKGSKDPIAIESPKGFKSSKARSNQGESYISTEGNDWKDITFYEPNTNVCLKAFTNGGEKVHVKRNLWIEKIDSISFSNGEEAFLKLKIKNEGNQSEKVALMVGLYDENNKMVNHSYINEEIKPNEEIKLSSSVYVPEKGKYTARGFVWDDSDHGISYNRNPIEITIQ